MNINQEERIYNISLHVSKLQITFVNMSIDIKKEILYKQFKNSKIQKFH